MDLDTAITMAKAQGEAWAQGGAPHQKHIGEAILRVVNAAQELKVMLDNPPVVVPATPLSIDPFMQRAEQAQQHQLAGKPPEKGSIEDTRKVTMPLAAAEGGLASGEIDKQHTLDDKVLTTDLRSPQHREAVARRHAKKSHG